MPDLVSRLRPTHRMDCAILVMARPRLRHRPPRSARVNAPRFPVRRSRGTWGPPSHFPGEAPYRGPPLSFRLGWAFRWPRKSANSRSEIPGQGFRRVLLRFMAARQFQAFLGNQEKGDTNMGIDCLAPCRGFPPQRRGSLRTCSSEAPRPFVVRSSRQYYLPCLPRGRPSYRGVRPGPSV